LRFKIKDIPADGRVVKVALPRPFIADALEGLDADLARSSGDADLELTRAAGRGEEIYVRGRLKGVAVVPCARCLAPATVAVDVPVQMTFVRAAAERPEVESSADHPLDQTDTGTHDGEWLDLAPTLRELYILSLPISPRCKESCAGLCAVCGADKNDPAQRDCGHPQGGPALLDPRFAGLKDLKLTH
jgi:uncharacterized protein